MLKPLDTLTMPKEVTSVSDDAFEEHCPRRLVAPFAPDVESARRVRELVITSPDFRFDIEPFIFYQGLESIELACDHPLYAAKDGILFSKDYRQIVYYPAARPGAYFRVPEGITSIGDYAFWHQGTLKEVTMAPSVREVGRSAFHFCYRMRSLSFSDEILSFPDQPPFGISALSDERHQITLPLMHMERIHLPQKLRYLGRNSLMDVVPDVVRLPASLEEVGTGSLVGAKHVWVYEGTAEHLLKGFKVEQDRGTYAHLPDEILVLDSVGHEKMRLLFPDSFWREWENSWDQVWMDGGLNYEAYEPLGLEVAEHGNPHPYLELAFHPDPAKAEEYRTLVGRASYFLGESYLEKGWNETFLRLLRLQPLEKGVQERLLKRCNELGNTTCIAYLLQEGKDHAKTEFPL